MGFEPTRAEHIGLAVQRLNHSATSSQLVMEVKVWNISTNCLVKLSNMTTNAGKYF